MVDTPAPKKRTKKATVQEATYNKTHKVFEIDFTDYSMYYLIDETNKTIENVTSDDPGIEQATFTGTDGSLNTGILRASAYKIAKKYFKGDVIN
ncbi:hypothetical protein EQG49_04420 [Periweissella cryptocerci]|uniref:Uncharacterized protein n=1 Tax=Periweissella cryptocerci TaxID=2506420 RepID=A0A4P6YSX4_9LACO|nr:hypothetical protein [Periweissella cryptocerci]QBO35760.1 hypothetical protein EQG49_04420 [Periweissella cryptocerci]